MIRFAAPMFAVALAALPATAQEDDGFSMMEEGARLILRGLMEEMDPALRELEGMAGELGPALEGFMAEMGPALQDLITKVEDWSAYHPPEILPNGDIIIRRKTDEEIAAEGEAIDL